MMCVYTRMCVCVGKQEAKADWELGLNPSSPGCGSGQEMRLDLVAGQ